MGFRATLNFRKGRRAQPPKAPAMCSLSSVLRKTDPGQIQDYLPTSENPFYQLQLAFVVNLIFRLTGQFEIVCLPKKLLTCRDPSKC